MFNVIETLLFQHNLALVLLAALVCALSAFAAITILTHARKSKGRLQKTWLAIAAVATGFGIWATHFIAMLAFDAGMATGYDWGLTTLSLIIAIAVTGGGLWMAAVGNRRSDIVLGGAIVGLGISMMHYTGMASIIVGGSIEWEPATVSASVLFGITFGALALTVALRDDRIVSKIMGAGIQTVAICAMHFTAMGAASFANCYAIVSGDGAMASLLLPTGVAAASALILVAAMTGVWLEIRERRRAERETDRMRDLANAAVEGLVVCDGTRIVTVNHSFLHLVDGDAAALEGQEITRFLDPVAFEKLKTTANRSLETAVASLPGASVPVEAVAREVQFDGKSQHAIAFRDLRDRKQAEQYIRYLAHHDALTGLPNRVNFTETLERELSEAKRHQKRLAVLCLDLDRFKEVNDLFGHAAGDDLLKTVGDRLRAVTSATCHATRLSGDEFAVLLSDIDSPAEAETLAVTILESFADESRTNESEICLAASIGIALYPDNAEEAADLMNHADTALYRAKQDGRGTYRFFLEEMGRRMRERRLLEHDLRAALDRDEFALLYQPQTRLDSGEITGFEALIRWNHPRRGIVPPDQFIPLAEESGLILRVGEWVLQTACREAASWERPLSVAVNVSAVQLRNTRFADLVHEVLAATGLSPRRLELEITETALVQDKARALSTLGRLKALGVRIAMDDFGTGYSSLTNLRAFPFDKIKIDKSFVESVDHSEQSATIVRAVLGLGAGLGLPVLAEGVETAEELAFLRGEVCAEAQGYFIGRPADIASFANLVSDVPREPRKIARR